MCTCKRWSVQMRDAVFGRAKDCKVRSTLRRSHRDALATGDLVLIYVGAREREFVGRAELASAAHDWTPSEAEAYPDDDPGGVLLAQVEEWDPPVPMSAVLSQIGPSETAKADFEAGVVRITADEYEAALSVAAERASSNG